MSRLSRRTLGLFAWLLALLVARPLIAQVPADAPAAPVSDDSGKFLRIERDDDGEATAMQTAIARFVPPADDPRQGLAVDLVAVIHIGEKQYYEQLNERFDDYDVVLYELVAPEGTRVPEGGGDRDAHPISMLQSGMKNMLELESQLEHIDYQRENFVHADMSPEQFAQSMRERGESMLTLFVRMMGQSIAQQNIAAQRNPQKRRNNDLSMFLAMLRQDRSILMKRMMAEQFEDLEAMMAGIEGPDGTTIISERNKVALEVLAQQIEQGKKRIAIFYGAGHMPDFAQRLVDEFGLQRVDQQWLVAWDLIGEKAAARDAEAEPASSP